MDPPALGGAVLEAVADVLCRAGGPSVSELGVFFAPPPPPASRTAAAAVRSSPAALGVASWALTPLYRAAAMRLRLSRADLRAATALLVATPDHATAWAARRRALARGAGGAAAELALNALLLRRAPKSVEAWAHRAWVLRRAGWGGGRAGGRVEAELALAEAAAGAAAGNYYAGVHRGRALAEAGDEVVREEAGRSRAWVAAHVSDCSGWWFHGAVVRRALRRVWGAADVGAERAFAEDAAARYGERYESVRKYRRWFEGAAADFLQRAGAGAGARRADGGRLRAGEAEQTGPAAGTRRP